MVKIEKQLKIPKEIWNDEFKNSDEHPIDLRDKLQKIIGESSGCVEAQIKVVDDTYLKDNENAVVEFIVGSDNGCVYCFLKKTIEENLLKFCEDCECGLGSDICSICVVGRRDAIRQLDRKPKTEPPVYLLTDMGKEGIPEIVWFARTREEAIRVMAKHEHPEHIELSYGSSSWLKIMEEEGW